MLKIMRDRRYVLGIILGILFCEITLLVSCQYRTPAISMYAFLHSRAYFHVVMLLCMLPAAFEYYEDIVDGNIRNILSRIQLNDYVRVKILSASLATWTSYAIIKLIFFVSYGIIHGFAGEPETEILLPLWSPLYNNGLNLLYLFFAIILSGLLPVLIMNIVLCISVMIPNISIIFTTPIACFYLGTLMLEGIFVNCQWMDASALFVGSDVLFGGRVLHLFFEVTLVILVMMFMEKITIILWRRRVYGKI